MERDNHMEGASNSRPPYFDGSDYPLWKTKMKNYLISLGIKVWRSILYGYEEPTIEDAITKEIRVKKEAEWDSGDITNCETNARALGAIFGAMSRNEVTRISSCVTAKEAWDILRTSHEGIETVRVSKLQMCTTRFEQLKMHDEENFDGFISRLTDIVNTFHSLGEPLSDLKVCRKILRSLPERFRVKVTAIEERTDVDKLTFAELVGKLQIFEINHLSDFKPSKTTSKSNNGIAFKSAREETFETCEDEDDINDEEIAMFAKKFRKFFRKGNNLGKPSKPSSSFKKNVFGNNDKQLSVEKSRKPQGIQCHECHGFGHIQSECANTLKKKMKKGLKVTWDDDSDEDGSESGGPENGEGNSRVSVLVASLESTEASKLPILSNTSSVKTSTTSEDEKEGDEDIGSIHEAYDEMYRECLTLKKKKKELESELKRIEKERVSLRIELDDLKKHNANLVEKFDTAEKERVEGLREVEKARSRICELEKDLSEASEAIRRNDCGATRIAEMTRTFRDKSGLGFIDPPSLQMESSDPKKKITFVSAETIVNPFSSSNAKSSENETLVSAKPVANLPSSSISKPIVHEFLEKRVLTCHHCGNEGHIRPKCYRLRRELRKKGQTQRPQKRFVPRGVVLGQSTLERPRNTSLKPFKNQDNDFFAQLNDLATQTSHIVKEINKLSVFAKIFDVNALARDRNLNGNSHTHAHSNKTWKKVENICHVAHIAYRAHNACIWYLDSGCSRHMTGDRSMFAMLENYDGGLVTFGDGKKGKVVGRGTISTPGLPTLHDVLFVDGLKANLLSIGQFCDNEHNVQFSKDTCSVLNSKGECVVKGIRSSDNCYCVEPHPSNMCHRVLLDDVEL
ncbi:uncharacterized protein LOC131298786 [Rhododendron vialii]|uniref:uncharacterized protein LOC131298785 n=1 Tax=Rhododendron vialii TaxID=182163 RepID=UPI00265E556A|nr:uncharacterized protein LOC131298785 [Rhododendron vialii]XP_058180239.1 uncharacterized protein LOC131298786 [Rhododendron vialii]